MHITTFLTEPQKLIEALFKNRNCPVIFICMQTSSKEFGRYSSRRIFDH